MSDDPRDNLLGGAERELESALRSLSPARNVSVDPVAAAFDAGRRSVGRQVLLWRGGALTATTALAASLLWFTALVPSQRAPVERPQLVTHSVARSVEPSDQSALRLREAVLERGWEALPRAAGGSSGRVMSVRDML